jgi:hypothetical protein
MHSMETQTMNATDSTPPPSLTGQGVEGWEPVGPRHLLGLVLGTCVGATAIQWCWDHVVGLGLPGVSTIVDALLPVDVPVALLALFLVKAAMTSWHPVFRLDVPAMWRALVLGSTAP